MLLLWKLSRFSGWSDVFCSVLMREWEGGLMRTQCEEGLGVRGVENVTFTFPVSPWEVLISLQISL